MTKLDFAHLKNRRAFLKDASKTAAKAALVVAYSAEAAQALASLGADHAFNHAAPGQEMMVAGIQQPPSKAPRS